MIKVVLDTNILVSANLKETGLEAVVLSLTSNRNIQAYVSPAILAEYETTLKRPKFLKYLTAERIEAVLQLVRKTSVLVTSLPAVSVPRHEEDNRFLECAEAAKADFLVTGNTKHFPKAWKTTQRVTARELLEIIGPELLEGWP